MTSSRGASGSTKTISRVMTERTLVLGSAVDEPLRLTGRSQATPGGAVIAICTTPIIAGNLDTGRGHSYDFLDTNMDNFDTINTTDNISQLYASMRRVARARGDKFYFTGRLCAQGHRTLRYTSSGGCVACLGVQRYDRHPLQGDDARPCKRGHLFSGKQCPICHRLAARRWRAHHTPGEAAQARQRANVAQCRTFLRTYKTMNACTDCGQHYPWYVMECDHLEPRAQTGAPTISSLVAHGSLSKLIQNLLLVDLVCANCHRTRTFQRHLAAGMYVDVQAS